MTSHYPLIPFARIPSVVRILFPVVRHKCACCRIKPFEILSRIKEKICLDQSRVVDNLYILFSDDEALGGVCTAMVG